MRRRQACTALAALTAAPFAPAQQTGEPLKTALAVAPLYAPPATPHYINALILSAQRRLATLAGTPTLLVQARSATAALRDAVAAPNQALPTDWPRLAGHAALAEAAAADGDAAAGDLAVRALRSVLADTPDGPRLIGLRAWTDDMFLAMLLVRHTAPLLPAPERARAVDALAAALLDHTHRLQRPDGLFDHAAGAPVAWGRGNGFAALALAQGLEVLPAQAQAPLIAALQRHLRRLLALQSAEGAWRQVLDEPSATLELTVTAMILTALAHARRHDWLTDAETGEPIARAWLAVRRRVGEHGTFADVCAGTPAGPTLDFYLQRPIIHGRDDRAAAVVLMAILALTDDVNRP